MFFKNRITLAAVWMASVIIAFFDPLRSLWFRLACKSSPASSVTMAA